MTEVRGVEAWRVRGSYFEACNCDAICPCRSVNDHPGVNDVWRVFRKPCRGISWTATTGSSTSLGFAWSCRCDTRITSSRPHSGKWCSTSTKRQAKPSSTRWLTSSSAGLVGRSNASTGPQSGRCTPSVEPASVSITRRHGAASTSPDTSPSKQANQSTLTGQSSCGIPGFDHPGIELRNDVACSEDPALRWEVRAAAGHHSGAGLRLPLRTTRGATGSHIRNAVPARSKRWQSKECKDPRRSTSKPNPRLLWSMVNDRDTHGPVESFRDPRGGMGRQRHRARGRLTLQRPQPAQAESNGRRHVRSPRQSRAGSSPSQSARPRIPRPPGATASPCIGLRHRRHRVPAPNAMASSPS